MSYLYYPGCSLEGTAREYDISTRALFSCLGIDLYELPDWTCCGASAAEAVSHLLSLALPARVLAMAEKENDANEIMVPCSACYLNLKKVTESVKTDPEVLKTINTVLEAENLSFKNSIGVKHLLEVLSIEVGPEQLQTRIKKELTGLTIAPYYGCQCLRPYPVFDNPERPTSMDPLLRAVGAKIHQWNMGSRCCGASQMTTKGNVAIQYVMDILQAAKGADAIVTVCPMCQMNLEAYQEKASKQANEDLHISVLYLPQLLGTALGLCAGDLGMEDNLCISTGLKERLDNTQVQVQSGGSHD